MKSVRMLKHATAATTRMLTRFRGAPSRSRQLLSPDRIIASPETKLEAGDILVAIGHREHLDRLEALARRSG